MKFKLGISPVNFILAEQMEIDSDVPLTVNDLIKKLQELVAKDASVGNLIVRYPEFGMLYDLKYILVCDDYIMMDKSKY